MYPCDGLASSRQCKRPDCTDRCRLPRVTTALANDRADAKNSGLLEAVYEWSVNGYLTRGGVSQAVISAYRADPNSNRQVLALWADINNGANSGDIAMNFDMVGDGWGPQIDIMAPTEQEEAAIESIAAGIAAPPTPPPVVATVTVISPNGSENWTVGSAHAITWSSTGTIANVKIEYTANNGGSWSTISSSTSNNGNFAWTIPNTASSSCLVRVSDASNSSTSDVSNALFTISSAPVATSTITVTAPNGGEAWMVGSNQNITWSSTGSISAIKIEYTANNGGNWNLITASTPNSGVYAWSVPNNVSTSCLYDLPMQAMQQ